LLRRRCGDLDRQIARQQQLYRSGASRGLLSWVEWNALLREREEAWDVAEAESDKLGHRYKDRNGQWRNTEPKDMTGTVLRRWCDEMGVEMM
jgi:hypothetical protein